MAHNVASGYAALFAGSLFSLALVPVALHYLGAESGHFALWMLMSTISGYMSLVDLGMSGSVARLLVDYKDQKAGGAYGSLIKTGWLVLWIQAGIILLVGVGGASILADVLKIEPELRATFIRLLAWQSVAMAVAMGVRIFSHILNAHQRSDIQNYGQISGLILNFGLMWWLMHQGYGVQSLAWATLATNLYNGVFCWYAGHWLKLFPPRQSWGKISTQYFYEMFSYGQSMFLIALGTQMINASQILIIQRELGAAAATIWGVGTRVFFLISQLIYRVFQSAAPTFSEMIVRGEQDRLQRRFREIVQLTASLSAYFAVCFVLGNSVFITVWTNGKISWPVLNNFLLAIWLVVLALLGCHNNLLLLTKKVGFMRYIYFVEGLSFLGIASMVAPLGGLPAVIITSIGCSCAFSGAYGLRRIHEYLHLPLREIGLRWLSIMARFLAFFVPITLATAWLMAGFSSALAQLIVAAVVCVLVGGGLFLRFGLPEDFQNELVKRSPVFAARFLSRTFGTKTK